MNKPSAIGCAFAALALLSAANAQCTNTWLAGPGLAGTDGSVNASTMWDPDGAGPATPVVVVGGSFTKAGDVASVGCATWDPVTGAWGALALPASLIAPTVDRLAVTPSGELIAVGVHYPGPQYGLGFVVGWNGTAWVALGTADQRVYALAALPNGDLVIGGYFSTVAGTPANRLARWDGTTWSAFGTGPNNVVGSLAVLASGELVLSGAFTAVDGVPCNYIARWNGLAWSSFGSGMDAPVGALRPLPNGHLIATGSFTTAGGNLAFGMAVWDGSSWWAVGPYIPSSTGISEVQVLPNGDLVATGTQLHAISLPVVTSAVVFMWSGQVWTTLAFGDQDSGGGTVTVLPGGDVLVGGKFAALGGAPANHMARWDGTNWSAVASGFVGRPGLPVLYCTAALPNGGVVVGGEFQHSPSNARNISVWNGTAWGPLGTGTNYPVFAISRATNGDIVAGGSFTIAGGTPVQHIARWNGTNWTPLGAGINGYVRCMAWLPNGDLVVGGNFTQAGGISANGVARWNGSVWSAVGYGLGGSGNNVHALAVLANGDLIAGGDFGGVARWNGTAWTAVGPPLSWSGQSAQVFALAALPNNTFAVGGLISAAGGVPVQGLVRWDGAAWQPYGTGPSLGMTVTALAVVPNGDLVASGTTANGIPGVVHVERWNGSSWSVMAGAAIDDVRALLMLANGELVVAGGNMQTNGRVSNGFARIGTTCPATATPFGSGCTGSGGANVLSTTALPWIGATFDSTAVGMPAPGLAVRVLGLGITSTPLASILPQGTTGCSLLVTPDLLEVFVPTSGIVTMTLTIPNTLALANQTLHQQVVALPTDATGAITALTSTNALTLTIGSF